MKTLIVYDTTGYIIFSQQGTYRVPEGIPFIETEIPTGYYAESVNPESQQPVLKEIPKSQEEKNMEVLLAAAMLDAENYTDDQAATVPTLYPKWIVGESVQVNDRRYYESDGKLYKCRQSHTTQESWTPDKTPAMWSVIYVSNEGSMEDPIQASRGMDYVYGKYYRDPEDSKIYLCKRTGEADGGTINLQYLPHELIGQYFELAE